MNSLLMYRERKWRRQILRKYHVFVLNVVQHAPKSITSSRQVYEFGICCTIFRMHTRRFRKIYMRKSLWIPGNIFWSALQPSIPLFCYRKPLIPYLLIITSTVSTFGLLCWLMVTRGSKNFQNKNCFLCLTYHSHQPTCPDCLKGW